MPGRKKFKLITVLIVLLGVLGGGYAVLAQDSGEPGSDADPVVTRSFVEQYVKQSIEQFKEQQPVETGQWQVLELKAGQTLECSAGTEFIVRSGKAVVVDPTPNGIPDVTSGSNIVAGQPVPLNHHFIVPRSDGRGIKASGPVWVMYKGAAKIN